MVESETSVGGETMSEDAIERFVGGVTGHSRLVLLVMVLLTAGMFGGMAQLDSGSQAGGTTDMFPETTVAEKADYVSEQYSTQDGEQQSAPAMVYVQPASGNALSKDALLEALHYQQAVLDADAVASGIQTDQPTSVANLIASRVAETPGATLDEQITALDAATDSEVASAVRSTLTADSEALALLPRSYEPGTAHAESHRMLFEFTAGEDGQPPSAAQRALYEAASEREGFFTLGEHARAAGSQQLNANTMELVVPFALVSILGILAFAYRDVVDVIVGMIGVGVSIVWMFGILGWLGVSAGMTMIIGPVLIAGLSIDFGFHVFNRYREEREAGARRPPRNGERGANATRERDEDGGIRGPMNRSVKLVATALILVTVTAAIGFMSNVVNPLNQIRDLGIAITLGVAAALFIFVTVVPALKISIDGLFERIGWSRRKQALGHGRFLRPALARTVTLARRGAPAVLVIALVVGAVGGFAWTGLAQESYQQPDGEVAEWKQQLPDPVGWETHPVAEQLNHVQDVYQPATADDAIQERILIEGDVTSESTLTDLQTGVETIRQRNVLVDQPGVRVVESPVTAMQALAQRDAEFESVFDDADTDGDGVPDRNLKAVYDAFYAADSDLASQQIERTDDEYRSMLVRFAVDADFTDPDSVVAHFEDGAAQMEAGGDRTATPAGTLAINAAVLDEIVGGILLTMGLALAAIVLTMAVVFRVMHGSATLGIVVALPIALVLGAVIGGMSLMGIPLTLLTALLMSLVIGLGVDYNIHIGDRFADELREGKSTYEALNAAVTGTGGALLGSTLTSAGAFATLALVPQAQIVSFSSIVVIALLSSFLVSLLVLPSLLVLWDRYSPENVTEAPSGDAMPQD